MSADLQSRLMAFWQARQPREQRMLLLGAGVLALGLVYGALYAPLQRARGELAKELPRQRAELRLMRTQVTEIERLRQAGVPRESAPLQRRLEASALARGLGETVKRITPLGADRVQLAAGERPARVWLDWLGELAGSGIQVQAVRLARGATSGLYTLESTLAAGGVP